MSSTNPFLKDFMQMRQSLQNSAPTLVKPDLSNPQKTKATKSDKPTPKKQKTNIFDIQQVNEQKDEEEVDMLQRICTEKPPKHEVADFLQNFANEMTIQKMK